MATKVVYTPREDKQGLQKQLGCMNGIFQLFDRRYLLGLHRHGRNQNRLTSGQDENGEKEFKNSLEKAKEKNTKKVTIQYNRASIESSRSSSSSSSSSTTISSSGCSKRVQKERQLPPGPNSPNFHKKKPDWPLQPPHIKTVVKDSMAREIRVKKDEQASPVMKHVDSPRPFIHQKSLQYDRKDQKLQKPSFGVKEVSERSRLSCDERKSQYSLKSTFKVNELTRLSLDGKRNSNRNSINESRSEPGSNKRPSSGVVARLMGLESLTDSIHEVETMKTKPVFDDQLVSSLRWSRNGEECKHNHESISPRVQLKNTKNAPASVYGEMEKRLSALEFKTSGNDLRALKQILEAMQTTKRGLDKKEQSLDSQKTDQPGSPAINRTSSPKSRAVKPGKIDTESMMITSIHNVNHATRKQINGIAPRNKRATGRTQRSVRSLSLLNSLENVTGEGPTSSPRRQSSKNGVEKQCFPGPSSDSNRIKEQSSVQHVASDLKTRHPKIKPTNPMQNNKQSCRYSNDGDTVAYKLESYTDLASQIKPGVMRNDQLEENHRIDFAERLVEGKSTVEIAKLIVEQQSPVSVLDAFYTEETLSPVKKKPTFFNDYKNLHDDESEWNHVRNDVLLKSTDTSQYSEFNRIELENNNHLIHQIKLFTPVDITVVSPCKSTNVDYRYVSEILSASGFLQDQDSAIRIVQLHPANNLIKPELFHILEKTNNECLKNNPRYKSNNTIRRKMIFDCVNDILLQKLVVSSGLWTRRRCGGLVNREKLLKELWSEIDNLHSSSERCLHDEDDEVKNLVSADVNKNLEDWDKCSSEVPGLVLDVERLIFKDLINEVVHAAEVATLQDRPTRYCRQLFSM